MHKEAVFDEKAPGYDDEFTDSYIGKNQREQIHQFLKIYIDPNGSKAILELNCGTGADISFLSDYGKVLATDVSQEMLKVVRSKNPGVEMEYLDLQIPLNLSKKFDLVFSNFGGFNCVNKQRLEELNNELYHLLNPDGKMVIVLMHKWSLLEFLYFSFRLNFKKAFRRMKGHSNFNDLPIYYYSKSSVKNIFSYFDLLAVKPVGVMLSGEYMNGPGKALRLNDSRTQWLFPILGADHMAYIFERKK